MPNSFLTLEAVNQKPKVLCLSIRLSVFFFYISQGCRIKHKSLHIKSVNIIYEMQKYQFLVRMTVDRAYAGVSQMKEELREGGMNPGLLV